MRTVPVSYPDLSPAPWATPVEAFCLGVAAGLLLAAFFLVVAV